VYILSYVSGSTAYRSTNRQRNKLTQKKHNTGLSDKGNGKVSTYKAAKVKNYTSAKLCVTDRSQCSVCRQQSMPAHTDFRQGPCSHSLRHVGVNPPPV